MKLLSNAVLGGLLAVLLSAAPILAQPAAEHAVPALAENGLAADIALAKSAISLLQARNFKAIREQLAPEVSQLPDNILVRMADAVGTGDPISIETISTMEIHNVQTGEGTSRILLEYAFSGRWLAADVIVKTTSSGKQFLKLFFMPETQPLSVQNKFHLLGKGMPQYLFLAAWLSMFAVSGGAMYLVFRRNAGWRRWILPLLMPVGLTPTAAMNWNTAQLGVLEISSNAAGFKFPIFQIRLPMALWGATWTGVPYLYISVPLIAAGYLLWSLRGRHPAGTGTSGGPQARPAGEPEPGAISKD